MKGTFMIAVHVKGECHMTAASARVFGDSDNAEIARCAIDQALMPLVIRLDRSVFDAAGKQRRA